MNKIFKYALFLFIVLGIIQNTAHAQYTENNVNMPSGNYHYNVPLMSIPYSGGSYSIGITCNSGVVMDQISGMIGLGWDFGVGSISRTVNGYPDDWKNKRVYDVCSNNSNISSYSYTTYPTIFNNYLFKYITRPPKRVSKEYLNVAGPLYFESVRTNTGNSCNSAYSDFLPPNVAGSSIQANNYVMDTKWVPTDKTSDLIISTTYLTDEFDRNSSIMPDYDLYSVSAEGLSGTISPKILEYGGLTYENNKISSAPSFPNDSIYKLYTNGPTDNLVKPTSQYYFYFNNEPTSTAKINVGRWVKSGTNYPSDPLIDFTNGGSPSDNVNLFGPVYNTNTNRKGCSRYIEYFTNKDIIENISGCRNRGFIETADVVNRNDLEMFDYDGIGAFTITNENGITYHFSLPVYQFEDVLGDKYFNQNIFVEHQNLNKYAYTWLLTSITGSNYEDLNGNHMVDEGDIGYWVKFSYGKWTDGYVWRTPYDMNTSYSYTIPTDNVNHIQYTWGRKQIYYLNSIQTNTHTALFIKSVKKDDLGCIGGQINNNYTKNISENVDYCDGFLINNNPNQHFTGYASGTCNYSTTYIMPEKHKLLKLDKIILVKNEDLASISMTNISGHILKEPVQASLSVNCQINNGATATRNYSKSFTCYYQNNILDDKDLEVSDIMSKAIQVIEFKQGYYLCYSTPNSDATSSEPNGPPNPDAYEKGKLALNEIYMNGLGGATVMPSYKFNYVKHTNLYNFNRQDSWGYDCGDLAYKSDATNNKSNYVDNWSLNNIITPMGSEISISYKSDVYTLEAANLASNTATRYGGGIAVDQIQIKDENNNIFKSKYTYSDGVTIYSPDGVNNRCYTYLNYLPLPGVMYKNVEVENLNAANETLSKTLYEYKVPSQISWGSQPGGGLWHSISMNCFTMVQNPLIPDNGNAWYEGNLQRIFTRNVLMVDNSSTIGRIEKITYKLGDYNDKIIKYNYLDDNPMPESKPEIGKVKETFKNRKLYYHKHDNKKDWYLTTSSLEVVPNVLESISTYNLGTESWQYFDLTKYDYNLGRCLETNTERKSDITYKDNVKTKTILAYTYYPVMGSKVVDINNKNLLKAECAFYNYAYKTGGTFNVTSSNVTTWNNQWVQRQFNGNSSQPRYQDLFVSGGNWLPDKSYIWKGNVEHATGFYDASFAEFNFSDIPSNLAHGWFVESEITRIDQYSNAIEKKDISNVYNSAKDDNNETTHFSIASCGGASYKNFAYSGFETRSNKQLFTWLFDFGSEVMGNQQNTTIVPLSNETIQPHTGKTYLKIGAEWGPGFQILWDGINNDGLQKGKKYRASVWVHCNSNSKVVLVADLAGQSRVWSCVSTSNSIVKIGDWKLLTIDVMVPLNFLPDANNEISLSFYIWNTLVDNPAAPVGSTPYLVNETIPYSSQYFSYIDDFVVAPVDANIDGFAFDSRTGWQIGSTNNDGYGMKYEFDNAGRVLVVKKETKNGFVKMLEKQYHFGRQQ